MKMNTGKLIYGGLFLILVAMAGIIIVSFRQAQLLHRTTGRIAETNEKLHLLENLLVNAIDNTINARGYALSGHEKYPENLKQTETGLINGLAGLRKDYVYEKSKLAILDSLEIYISGSIKLSNQIVAARKQKGMAAAAALVTTGEGEAHLAVIRRIISGFETDERLIQQQLMLQRQDSFLLLNRLLPGSLMIIMIFIVVVLLLVRDELTRRKKQQMELSRFNENPGEEVKQKIKEQAVVFERITDAFVALDKDWCYTYMNKKAGEIFNRDPEKMIGKHIWTEFPEGIGQPFHKAYEKAMNEQQYVYFEEYYAPYDRWFENHIYPSPEGVSVFFRDITEKKKTELKLQESEERYHTLIEQAADGFILINEKGKILIVNNALCELLGYTREELLALHITDTYPETDRHIAMERLAKVTKTGTLPFERLMLKKDGGLVPVETIISKTTEGNFQAIGRDITERKKAETELRNEKERFEKIVNTIPGVICTFKLRPDGSTCYPYCGPGMFEMFGLKPEELTEDSTPLLQRIHPDDIEKTRKVIFTSAQDLTEYRQEFRYNHPQKGWIWLESNSLPSAEPDGSIVWTGFASDITKSKQVRDELWQLNRQFSTLINNLPGVVFRVRNDPNYTTEYVSDQIAELTGYPADDFRKNQRNFGELMHPNDRESVWNEIQIALAEHHPYQVTYRFIDAQGQEKWNWERGMGVYDANGELQEVEGFVLDITERKKDEQALIEKGNFIESIINASPDIIYIYDIEERKNIFINEGMQVNLGYSDAEIKEMGNQVLPLLMHPDDFQFYVDHTYPRYAGTNDKEIIQHEFRMHDKNGNWHWLSCKESIFLRQKDGTPKQIFGITIDITERKKTEEKLVKSEELFSGAFHASPAGIIITRIADGKIIDANQSFLKIFDLSREETIGHTSIELGMLTPTERTKLIEQQIASGGLNNSELLSKTKSGKQINLFFSSKPLEINGEACHITTLIDITERKKAERAIKESEEKYRTLTENLNELVYRADPETLETIFVNKAVENIYGYTVEEWLSDPLLWESTIYPEDKDRVFQQFSEMKNMGKDSAIEYRIIHKDGMVHWVIGRFGFEIDTAGRLTALNGVMFDITDRKKAEEEIRKSEELYKDLVDNITDLICTHDLDGRILSMNSAAEKSIGFRFDSQRNFNLKSILTTGTKNKYDGYIADILQNGYASGVMKIKNSNGEIRIWEFNNSLKKTEDNSPPVIRGYARDITERTKAEEGLKQSEEKYRTLFEQMDEGFCTIEMIYDSKGIPVDYRFLEVNPAFVNQTGLTDALNRTILEMVPGHDPHWFRIYGEVAKTGKSIRFENKAEAMGRYYDVFAFRIGGDGSLKVGVFFYDITERKKTEEAIYQLNQELEQRVKERTSELEKANIELEEINDLFVGREARIIELKEELEELKNKLRL